MVGITGASGAAYGVRLLEQLQPLPVETHLIATKWARVTIEHETGKTFAQVKALADHVHAENDQAAAISSGSFLTHGMLIAPCSTKTLAASDCNVPQYAAFDGAHTEEEETGFNCWKPMR